MSTQELEQKIVSYLAPFQPKQIALFGSYARGDNTDDSDVDVLVTFTKPIGLEFFGLAEDLENILHKKVDLTTPASLSKYVRPYVEKDLKIIYSAL